MKEEDCLFPAGAFTDSTPKPIALLLIGGKSGIYDMYRWYQSFAHQSSISSSWYRRTAERREIKSHLMNFRECVSGTSTPGSNDKALVSAAEHPPMEDVHQ